MGGRGSTEPTRLSGYAVCRQATLLHIGSILLSFSRIFIHLSHFLFLSSTRPSSFLHVSVSFSRSLSLSSSLARHAALVRSHSRSPLCCLWFLFARARSFNTPWEREVGEGGKGQGERSDGGSGLSRARKPNGLMEHDSIVGWWATNGSFARSKPARLKENRGRVAGRSRVSPSR